MKAEIRFGERVRADSQAPTDYVGCEGMVIEGRALTEESVPTKKATAVAEKKAVFK